MQEKRAATAGLAPVQGVTQFEAVFQGDYEYASGNGVKIPFKGKVTIVP